MSLVVWTAEYLAQKGFEESRLTAELLLADTLGLKRLDLYLQFERPLTAEELGEFKTRLKRRVRHEPLQYIAGSAAFRDLVLAVDRRVLIPRPETELLVGEVLKWAAGRSGLDVIDVGTGSGAIALSLRVEGSFGRVVATDLSPDALEVARSNGERVLPEGEVEFRQGFGLEPVRGEKFDIIVSNPPYIGEVERSTLPAEVIAWEPAGALFSGEDGLGLIRELVSQAPTHLREGGLLALEIGAEQGPAVAQLVCDSPSFREPSLRRDLTGRDRFMLVELAVRDP